MGMDGDDVCSVLGFMDHGSCIMYHVLYVNVYVRG